jgi:gamma-glutamyltranspeptidase/glutathione hydrolase
MSDPQKGAAAGGHIITVQAAAEVLAAGGNAMDAAVAAALAAGVCEPLLMGLGGGMIATIRDGATGRVHVLDAFSAFPGRDHGLEPREFQAIRVEYGPTFQIFHAGRGAVAVPTVAVGLEALHKRWGTLPMEQLAAPAIRTARAGWTATAATEVVARMLQPITRVGPESDALFNPGGVHLREGDRVRMPAMADAIEDFAREGAAPFTTGRHAQALLEAFGPPGGSLGPSDLTAFEPVFLKALAVPYRGATLYVPPPPCMGGALLAFGLELLDRVMNGSPDRIEVARCVAAVMAETERARAEGFDERMFEDGAVEHLLSEANLADHAVSCRAMIERSRKGGAPEPGVPIGAVPGNTTHLSIVDAAGNAVALTSSNGETCGTLWPGTSIAMNNFLGEDDIHPLGFHLGPVGARLRTMMTPSLLVEADGGVLAMGTGGSNRIRTAMLQVVRYIVSEGQGIEAAIMAPRIHVEGGTAQVEDLGQGEAFMDAISGGGEWKLSLFPDRHLYFGGVHTAAWRGDGCFEAVGDPRRSGAAVVV